MAPRLKAKNNAVSTLNGAITASATSLVVISSAPFPEPPFRVTIDDEIIEVGAINRSTHTFSSLTRGVEGTIAASHASTANVEQRWTAGTYDELYGTNGGTILGPAQVNPGDSTQNYHIELYHDEGTVARPIRLRFHQGNRFWGRIEFDGDFHIKTGDPTSETYENLKAADVYSSGNLVWHAGTLRKTRKAKVLSSPIAQGISTSMSTIDAGWNTFSWDSNSIVMVIVDRMILTPTVDYTLGATNTITFNSDIPTGSTLDVIVL